MIRRGVVLIVAAVALLTIAAPVAAQTDEDQIVITALHAIPGENDFPADVYLNGDLAIAGFTKMMATDPFVVEPGELTIELFAAGADPATAQAAITQTVTLDEAGNFVLVAQLTSTGEPILSVYANSLAPIPMGQARLVYRHTSALGPVEVFVNGESVGADVTSTDEITVTVAAGESELTVVGADGVELSSSEVDLLEGQLTSVYAVTVGEAAIEYAVQVVGGLESAPVAVQTGSGGLRADSNVLPLVLMVLLVGIGALGVRFAARRS